MPNWNKQIKTIGTLKTFKTICPPTNISREFIDFEGADCNLFSGPPADRQVLINHNNFYCLISAPAV